MRAYIQNTDLSNVIDNIFTYYSNEAQSFIQCCLAQLDYRSRIIKLITTDFYINAHRDINSLKEEAKRFIQLNIVSCNFRE